MADEFNVRLLSVGIDPHRGWDIAIESSIRASRRIGESHNTGESYNKIQKQGRLMR
ncbi:MAG: hypothetical protein OHK0012_08910 [Synechococcales cyanobacterium]